MLPAQIPDPQRISRGTVVSKDKLVSYAPRSDSLRGTEDKMVEIQLMPLSAGTCGNSLLEGNALGCEEDDDLDIKPFIPRFTWLKHLGARLISVIRQGKWVKNIDDGFSQRLIDFPCRRINNGQKSYRQAGLKADNDRYAVYTKDLRNAVCNQRYTIFTFIPQILFEQFKHFSNFCFLLLSLSQIVPTLKVGPFYSYMGPLVFVIGITLIKESIDDFKRYQRDKEVNEEKIVRLKSDGSGETEDVRAMDIRVGDLIQLGSNDRIPADCIFLQTSDASNQTYVRTDQLDGETDWKLRRPPALTSDLTLEELSNLDACTFIDGPKKDIYDFTGRVSVRRSHRASELSSNSSYTNSFRTKVEGFGLENTLWANCIVTQGNVIGMVIYAGTETRASLNTNKPDTKFGLLDEEIDWNTKLCSLVLLCCCMILTGFNIEKFTWWTLITLWRFIVVLSYIIPSSLRVNLDFAKLLFSMRIQHDQEIAGTIMRNTGIPEELGRIDYLLTDKTGTLTQNEMIFKKIRVATGEFNSNDMARLQHCVRSRMKGLTIDTDKRRKKVTEESVFNAILALAVCHNVTPITTDEGRWSLQAASPDEVALVKFAAEVGIKLVDRDDSEINVVQTNKTSDVNIDISNTREDGTKLLFDVVACFPFTSTSKRMGILVRDQQTNELWYYLKGADVVMAERISCKGSGWLQEEVETYARSGLRTLVMARKFIKEDEYRGWAEKYEKAKASMHDREAKIRRVVDLLETKMELLALTGVEDKLQENVEETLEALRHGNVKVWMLTGDKVETAICIAISTSLKGRHQGLYVMDAQNGIETEQDAMSKLREYAASRVTETVLVLDGYILGWMIKEENVKYFIEAVASAPAVVCCRCSPTQKADVVAAIKKYTGKRTAAIGDGGNDVSMIQSAHIGIGIVGKEGKQASLCADVSVLQFCSIRRLMLWHGRNAYLSSARMATFVIHRGLIISIIQVIFSSLFYFVAVPIFQGMLMVGYSTVFTMFPVFALCLDTELPSHTVFMYPELYASLRTDKRLSNKIFLEWLWKSIYQGTAIMLMALELFSGKYLNIVAITFTALILSELLNVASEVHHWHEFMIMAEVLSLYLYAYAMLILRSYFDVSFIFSYEFLWKLVAIVAVSWMPVHIVKIVRKCVKPPTAAKLLDDPELDRLNFA